MNMNNITTDFLQNLSNVWPNQIFIDYHNIKILYESDLYTNIFNHLNPFINQHPNLRFLTEYWDMDMLLLQTEDGINNENQNPHDMDNWDNFFRNFLVYFEFKLHNNTHQQCVH